MSIPPSLVGMTLGPVVHDVDLRWTMSYAAGLGDHQPCYLDTTRPEGVVAHPLFAVCPEWPVIVASRELSETAGVTRAEVITGVHATHDVTIHRLVQPGDRLSTTLEIVGLVDKRPGAFSTMRLETVDSTGQPVASTTQGSIYLGVPASGDPQPDPAPPPAIEGNERRGEPTIHRVPLVAGAAHVYTECARIWNPIHTDPLVAMAAGLSEIILHGTANLAHAVSIIVASEAANDPAQVRRIAGRFAAMVPLPSTLTVKVWPANSTSDGRRTVPFEVLNEAGQPAVQDGCMVLG
ncbi:MAG: MaoC/PaaZ C-terminal domain-containing protein [Actinomycetota bacterium]|nr:MaoC/PaaZ C-terminal domain-containing protein [Actinomycetota bacterium]